ncbi:MAG: hypothetical protein IKS32_01875 [Solobacterium sp.]|nr:hypothetical protein [Solobacterium sp.]
MNLIQKHILQRAEIEEMTERELLMELVAEKRRAETWRILHLCFDLILLLVFTVAAVIYGPKVIRFFQGLSEAIQNLQQQINDLSEIVGKISAGLSGFAGLFGVN